MRTLLTLLIVVTVAACGGATTSLKAPPGIEAMARVDGADVAKSFPGYDGPVFALGGDDGAHWFGVLSRGAGEGPKHLLVGISPHRVWSEPLTLEAAEREITELDLVGAWLGDLQRDGATDLLLHLRMKSKQTESGRSHVRDVVRLYSLGKDLRETFLGTLSLDGSAAAGCRRVQYDYRASIDWQQDKTGGIRALDLSSRVILETCAPTQADCKGPVICGVERNEETEAYIWDPDLGAFRPEDANDAPYTLPHNSFK